MDFLELAQSRYSVRKFKDTPISDDDLQKIIDAGMCAPTARNRQPQRIYVIKSQEGLEKIRACSPCTYGAPCVILFCYDKVNGAMDDPAPYEEVYRPRFGEVDTTIVMTHMMLEAWNLGIGSCEVGLFDIEKVKKLFDLPETEYPLLLLPIGYADMPATPRHFQSKAQEELIREC